MRIVCQKCAAAYAIDDRLITAKGVRAQCPRCRNLQLVRRDSSAVPSGDVPATAPRPASSAPPVADDLFAELGGPASVAPTEVSSAHGRAAKPAADLFADFGAPPPEASPAPGADPFASLGDSSASGSGDPLLDFLGPAPTAPPAPVARMSQGPGAVPVSVMPPSAAAPAPARAAAQAAAAAPKSATMGCRTCGKSLLDPFDQALGICDGCRQREPAGGAPKAAAPTPAPAVSADFLPPLSAPEEGGGESLELASRTSPAPALASEPRSNPRAAPARVASGVRSGSAEKQVARASSGGRWALVGGLVLLAAGSGVAGFFYLKHQEAQRLRNAAPPPVAAIPEAVQQVLPRWKLKYLVLEGTPQERLAEGQAQLARDERFAYAEAEESFQQALLLDPRSDEAIGGYIQALALGRGAGLDDATFAEATSLVEAAEVRAGRTPWLLLAHANLLLTRFRQEEPLRRAKELAEESLANAQATAAQKADAHLVLGRVYLSSSGALAHQHFDSAQKLAPELKRIQYYRALAHESAGEYRLALETLRKRLTADPRDWDSLATTSRIYQEIGEPDEARKLYEERVKADPGELRALLPLAVLRYQSEGSPAVGVRELRALLKNRERYGQRDVAEVLVHLAAAERALGNSDAALKAAEEALGLSAELPEAHLQVFLVALEQKDAAKARKHLSGIQGWLGDRALEAVLEGRVLLLEKKPAQALERFTEASTRDDRRLDAQLLAGVAAAGAKRREDAFRVLNQALRADPLRLEPRALVTRFWMRPSDTVRGVEDIILALAENADDPGPYLYEGLLRFHQGDLDAADRHFREVLESDSNNAGAMAYRALIALHRGNASEARALAARAVSAGRQLPVAHLAQGWVLAEGKQVEPAKRSLREALNLSPTLLSAKARLAQLEVPQRRADARAQLVSVVGLDPAYLPAKRMLYLLER
ncbi:zinc-ribbon domain-containing protein [Myxococcus landrumensis]|uniref:Zinc-ribbon domain-containing protein n=1 Tax=Myxococcus landrumensis TaxID=2813577 RepID=A0ABX7ND55_9BACT|nr:zinc-ribbon domain-containing protein [Myxococcus landrumus]QSQ16299.1 zinc-ribbon domain-containing protein [Myxococcus landrumus]